MNETMFDCVHKRKSVYLGHIYCGVCNKDKEKHICNKHCYEYEAPSIWLVLGVEHTDDLGNPPMLLHTAFSYEEAEEWKDKHLKRALEGHPDLELNDEYSLVNKPDEIPYSYILDIVEVKLHN